MDNVVKVVKLLSRRPQSWEECVTFSRIKFEKSYNHKVEIGSPHTRAYTHAHTHTRAHACTHTHARTHTRTHFETVVYLPQARNLLTAFPKDHKLKNGCTCVQCEGVVRWDVRVCGGV